MKMLLLAILLMAIGAHASAASCDQAANQAELTNCADQAFKASDASLNAAYQQLVQRLKDDPATLQFLVAAEKAWINFRETECDFAASGETGGSIYPMTMAMCRDALTRQRVTALHSYLTCKEGDTLCPVPAP